MIHRAMAFRSALLTAIAIAPRRLRCGGHALLWLAALAVAPGAVVAQSAAAAVVPKAARPAPPPPSSPLTDHFSMRGIYYQPSLGTDGRFDSDAGTLGTPFSGEADLGLDDQATQGRLELTFRIRDRHRLRADYLKLDRLGDRTLTRTVAFRNRIFNVGDRVESEFNFRVLGLTYGWSFFKREQFEIGAGVGFHLLETESRAIVRARGIREEGRGVGVLPTLALDGTWRFARRWSVTGRFQYLSVGANDIEGSFADHHLDVQYRWKPNVAFGLGYSQLKLDVQIDDADLPGKIALDAKGPELFFRVSF